MGGHQLEQIVRGGRLRDPKNPIQIFHKGTRGHCCLFAALMTIENADVMSRGGEPYH